MSPAYVEQIVDGCSRRVKTIVTDMVIEEVGDTTATMAEGEDMVAEEEVAGAVATVETVTVIDGVAGVMAVDMEAAMVVGEGDTGTAAVAGTETIAAVVVGMEEVAGATGGAKAVDTMVCFLLDHH